MGILWYILAGVVVGILARLIHPGRERMGWIMTLLIGIGACFLAGLIGDLAGWWDAISWLGFIVAVAVAVLLLMIYGRLAGGRSGAASR